MSTPTLRDLGVSEPREPRNLTYAEYYNMRACDFAPNDTVAVKIVAVIGAGALDWAAYLGLSHWDDAYVAESGDKLPAAAAEAAFPTIAARFAYRR
jgi:hypothetical protein